MTEEKINEINLLDLVPRRNVDYETGGNGMVTLLTPRFRNKLLLRHLQPRLKRPHFKVDLDEFGSFVWLRCDGEKSTGEIAEDMRAEFGEKAEPLLERLKLFFGQLEKLKYIEFINIEECRKKIPDQHG
ncbi:MAG: PqqD family peptide modification chaperone [Candidatus Latescibacteria bacterium]|nr:PqqD family peptide modification chaperone [Candidatus Latescibacterota bacterium]